MNKVLYFTDLGYITPIHFNNNLIFLARMILDIVWIKNAIQVTFNPFDPCFLKLIFFDLLEIKPNLHLRIHM